MVIRANGDCLHHSEILEIVMGAIGFQPPVDVAQKELQILSHDL
jgi:hypothetical protein